MYRTHAGSLGAIPARQLICLQPSTVAYSMALPTSDLANLIMLSGLTNYSFFGVKTLYTLTGSHDLRCNCYCEARLRANQVISAARPAMCGAAKLLPVHVPYCLLFQATRISTPGAPNSTDGEGL